VVEVLTAPVPALAPFTLAALAGLTAFAAMFGAGFGRGGGGSHRIRRERLDG
jgi:hypothetical protein